MEHKVICVFAMVLMLALSSLAQDQAGKTTPPCFLLVTAIDIGPGDCCDLLFPVFPYAVAGLGP